MMKRPHSQRDGQSATNTLFTGDRAGSRYYDVLENPRRRRPRCGRANFTPGSATTSMPTS
jgi:hypothetical protein